jgi:hypothetical protein
MGHSINRFKQTDVVRALKAATAAGLAVGGIKVNTKTSEITVLAKGDAPNGHHSWAHEEIKLYRSHWPLGTEARLAMEFALETTSRRS